MSQEAAESSANAQKRKSSEEGSEQGTPKRNRAYNFWKMGPRIDSESKTLKSKTTGSGSNVAESGPVDINSLTEGIYSNRPLCIRISGGFGSGQSDKGNKYLPFRGMDSTGEIGFVTFSDVDAMEEKIKINHVYKVENFRVEKQKEQFANKNAFKVVFNSRTSVEELNEDGIKVAAIPFQFIEIDAVISAALGCKVDFMGIVTQVDEIRTIQAAQDRKKAAVRDIYVTDRSKEIVMVTLWNLAALNFSTGQYAAIAIHNAEVGEFNSVIYVKTHTATLIWVDPEIDEARELKTWFDMEKAEQMKLLEKELPSDDDQPCD